MSKNIKLIYKKAQSFINSRPKPPKGPLGGYETTPQYLQECEDFFIRAMLLIKEFDGVSGPLYTNLKKHQSYPSGGIDDVIRTMGFLIDHLENFYSEDLT